MVHRSRSHAQQSCLVIFHELFAELDSRQEFVLDADRSGGGTMNGNGPIATVIGVVGHYRVPSPVENMQLHNK